MSTPRDEISETFLWGKFNPDSTQMDCLDSRVVLEAEILQSECRQQEEHPNW